MKEPANIVRVAWIALLMLAWPGQAQEQDGWNRYRNERFGFLLLYPPNLVPGPAGVGSAGRAFSAADGSFNMFVHGFYLRDREENETWKQFFEKLYRDQLQQHGSSVTYKAKRDTWYVISGVEAGDEYYDKVFYRGEDRDPVELSMVYPHALASRFNLWVEQIVRTFVPTIPGEYE